MNVVPVDRMDFHPLADTFPLLDGDEFQSLADDIREHGLREGIWLYESQILDGRNRYRACIEAGEDAYYRTYDGDDPLAFVVSLNLKRRHLNESQRAMVAAKIAQWGVGDNQHTGSANLPTQSEAADMLNVSGRSVRSGRVVQQQGAPELVDAVERGEVSVSAAADVATKPEDEQREIVARGEKEILAAAKQIRARRANIATKFTGDPEWYTPAEYVEAARMVMGGIDVDPASNPCAQNTVRADLWYGKDDDGLAQKWAGRIFLNPPYAYPTVEHFIEKLCSEVEAGNVSAAILLTNNNTDTKWWHLAVERAAAVCFTAGRISFYKMDGKKSQPTNGQTFFYFGDAPSDFAENFSRFGFVVGVGWKQAGSDVQKFGDAS